MRKFLRRAHKLMSSKDRSMEELLEDFFREWKELIDKNILKAMKRIE